MAAITVFKFSFTGILKLTDGGHATIGVIQSDSWFRLSRSFMEGYTVDLERESQNPTARYGEPLELGRTNDHCFWFGTAADGLIAVFTSVAERVTFPPVVWITLPGVISVQTNGNQMISGL